MPETFDLDDDLDHDGPAENITQSRRGGNLRNIIIGVVAIVVVFGGGFAVYRMVSAPGKSAITANGESGLTDQELAQKKEQEELRNKNVKYEKLYEQLSGEQAAAVAKELSYSGILFETEQKGKYFDLLVDRDRIQEARKTLALKGLPAGGIVGYEIFDNASNMGVTDFDKRVRFIRAISGELEKAIIQLESIEGAKVQVVMPEQRLFAVSQPPVTAAILVRRRPYIKRINDETVYGIIKLVSNAVENLQPENVTVVDTDGHVLSEGVFERMRKKVGAKTARVTDIDAAFRTAQLMDNSNGGDMESAGPSVSDSEEAGISIKKTAQKQTDTTSDSSKSDKADASNKSDAADKTAKTDPEKINLQDFLAYKKSYEADLTQKATDQVGQIMSKNSFKVSVSTEMKPPKTSGNVPDVKKISISIVLNQLMPDSNLTPAKKKALFSMVGGSVGYVKGRDRIVMTKSDFIGAPESPDNQTVASATPGVTTSEMAAAAVNSTVNEVTSSVASVASSDNGSSSTSATADSKSGGFLEILKMIGIGILVILVLGGVGYGLIKLFKKAVSSVKRLWGWLNSSDEVSGDAMVSASGPELDSEVDNLRRLAATQPEKVAQVMERWLQESEVAVR